jgi:hypothetical protein
MHRHLFRTEIKRGRLVEQFILPTVQTMIQQDSQRSSMKSFEPPKPKEVTVRPSTSAHSAEPIRFNELVFKTEQPNKALSPQPTKPQTRQTATRANRRTTSLDIRPVIEPEAMQRTRIYLAENFSLKHSKKSACFAARPFLSRAPQAFPIRASAINSELFSTYKASKGAVE